MEHLKLLLGDGESADAFAFLTEMYAQAKAPQHAAKASGMCKMVALSKGAAGIGQAHGPSSRVRGLAVGDVTRRLLSRTLAQQFELEFASATAPHQFGLGAKGGVDAAAHLIRYWTEASPTATITQIDGVGAYDHIHRAAMLTGVRRLPTAHRLLPFLLQTYGQPSTYLWHDGDGVVHKILQGEGGEQGDALMPALYSIGQAEALREAQCQLLPTEWLVAYLDDVYIITEPDRARAA